jgi:hypothetical protein
MWPVWTGRKVSSYATPLQWKPNMKTTRNLSLPVLLLAVIGGAAAQGLSREQVKAELAEARRTGDIIIGGELGQRLFDAAPDRYPAPASMPAKARSQVKAELEEARRTGDLTAGEAGLKLNQQRPDLYPPVMRLAGKSRDQVRAELAEARALGNLLLGEDGRTLAEAFPQRYAAIRAEHAKRNQQLDARREVKVSATR